MRFQHWKGFGISLKAGEPTTLKIWKKILGDWKNISWTRSQLLCFMIKTRSFSLLNSCKYHLIYIDNNQLVSLFVSLCTDLSKIWIVTCSNNNQDLYIVSMSNTSVHLYLIYDVLGVFFYIIIIYLQIK